MPDLKTAYTPLPGGGFIYEPLLDESVSIKRKFEIIDERCRQDLEDLADWLDRKWSRLDAEENGILF